MAAGITSEDLMGHIDNLLNDRGNAEAQVPIVLNCGGIRLRKGTPCKDFSKLLNRLSLPDGSCLSLEDLLDHREGTQSALEQMLDSEILN
jgi:hypothetical protein